MTYLDNWKAIAARIESLVRAAQIHIDLITAHNSDSFGRGRYLHRQSSWIFKAILAWRSGFAAHIPDSAQRVIDQFEKEWGALFKLEPGSPDWSAERQYAVLVLLPALASELTFLLSDVQQAIRARSERAFAHLQRSIVADPEFKVKWERAFALGEMDCEKLGAVHLLLHGIWAFKINAAGERTDLVFTDQPVGAGDDLAYADGLVLTEWKRCKADDKPDERFDDARKQAGRYTQGVLAGSELTAYRYAIVVSKDHIVVPPDLIIGEVIYRHINIAVTPLSPSKG